MRDKYYLYIYDTLSDPNLIIYSFFFFFFFGGGGLVGKRSKLHGTKVHGARARAFDVFCSQMS